MPEEKPDIKTQEKDKKPASQTKEGECELCKIDQSVIDQLKKKAKENKR